jgi:hypothetical protein
MKRYEVLRNECPYIALIRYSKYAYLQVDFYKCEDLNTHKARREVIQLFKRHVMDRSSFWQKLFMLKYKRYKKSDIKSIISYILSVLVPNKGSDVTTPIFLGLCGGKTSFGIGYDTWNFCAEKELIENFTSMLIHYIEENMCSEKAE